jgi:protein-L-isoaspartate(D-aspartate) O-methyltransferase
MPVRVRFATLVLLLCLTNCKPAAAPVHDFATERDQMVREQIIMRGVTDPRVLAALRKVPREEFVPAEDRDRSYTDQPLPIGERQTISQPFIVALMTEQLHLEPTDRVLEVGTGSGYQAAILSELAAEVYTIEIVPSLGKRATTILARLGYRKVHVKIGDGYQGWPEAAPFDAVVVTCAPEKVPQTLVAQTKEGGRIVIPVGPPVAQELFVFEKRGTVLHQTMTLPVRFVPMTRATDPAPH